MAEGYNKPLIYLAHLLSPHPIGSSGSAQDSCLEIERIFSGNVSRGECKIIQTALTDDHQASSSKDITKHKEVHILHLAADDWGDEHFLLGESSNALSLDQLASQIMAYPIKLVTIFGKAPTDFIQKLLATGIPVVALFDGIQGQRALSAFYLQLSKNQSVVQAISHIRTDETSHSSYEEIFEKEKTIAFVDGEANSYFFQNAYQSNSLNWKINRRFVLPISKRKADKDKTKFTPGDFLPLKQLKGNKIVLGIIAFIGLCVLSIISFTDFPQQFKDSWSPNSCPFPRSSEAYHVLLLPFRHASDCREKDEIYYLQLKQALQNYAEKEQLSLEIGEQASYPCPLSSRIASDIVNSCSADLVIWGTYYPTEADTSLSIFLASTSPLREKAFFSVDSVWWKTSLNTFQAEEIVADMADLLRWGQGINYMNLRAYELATDNFEAIQSDLPEIQLAVDLMLTQCFKRLHKYEQAIERLNNLATQYPERVDVLRDRANAYVLVEKYEMALKDLHTAISLDTLDAESYIQRGILLRKQKKYTSALRDFATALKLSPTNVKGYKERANVYVSQKKYVAAQREFDQALQLEAEASDVYISLGKMNLAQGKWVDGKQAIQKAIAINPRLRESYYTRAEIYAAMGIYDSALVDYGKAISISPTYLEAYLQRAQLYENLRQYKRALADYHKILLIRPNYPSAIQKRIELAIKTKAYDKALTYANDYLELTSAASIAYSLRGQVYLAMEDYDQALTDFDQAIALDSQLPVPYLYRADLHIAKEAFDQALQDANQAIRLDDSYSDAFVKRATIHFALGNKARASSDLNQAIRLNPSSFQAYYTRGLQAYATKAYKQAVKDLTKVLKLQPQYLAAYRFRAKAFQAQRNYPAALADYRRLVLMDHLPLEVQMEQASLFLAYHQYEQAFNSLSPVYETNQENPHFVFLFGQALDGLGQLDSALAAYNTAIELAPDSALFYCGRARFWLSRRSYTNALKDYQQALEIKPEYIPAFVGLAQLYSAQDKPDLALEIYDQALAIAPDDVEVYMNRASLYADLDEYKLAFEDIDEAIQLDRYDAAAYNLRGNLFRQEANYSSAFKDYQRAIELHPYLADPYYNRGFLHSVQRNYEAAAKDLQKSIQLDPKDGIKYGLLAKVYAKQGKEELLYQNLVLALKYKYPVMDLKYDPAFERYRDSDKFQALIRKK